MSGQCVSHVLFHLTWGAVLPVAATFSLWLLRVTVIQCVSWHDGWHLHSLCNHSLAHYCFSFSLLRGSKCKYIPEPKTTEIIICVMYDVLSSEDKSSDDLECLANTAVAVLVLPVRLFVGSWDLLDCIVDIKSPQLNRGWCSSFYHPASLFLPCGLLIQYLKQKPNSMAINML